ncbi:fibronectin type III domain-containing protein, partial [Pseudarthrobacter sulfonivorans]
MVSTISAQPAQAAVSQPQIDAAVARILGDTNAERSKAGLTPLKLNTAMNTVAQNWSQVMGDGRGMVHNPDYASQIPQGWQGAAENVAYGYSPSSVTGGWMGSEGHKRNILGTFTHIGIGYYIDDRGRGWFTQNFGRYEVPNLTIINEPVTTVGKFEFTSTWAAKWDEPVDGYSVELSSADGTLLRTESITVPTVTFTGLTDRTAYTVKVAALKTDALGTLHVSPARTYAVTTLEDLPSVTAPSSLMLSSTDTSVTAAWAAPLSSYGVVLPYRVELLAANKAVVQTAETSDLNYVFLNLTSNTDYTVSVTAKTQVRDNTASAFASKTTKTAPSSAAAVTDPTNFAVVSDTHSSIKATWAEPTTRTGEGLTYKLTLSTLGKPDVVAETASLAHTFPGLTGNTRYSVKIQASITAENGANKSTSAGVTRNVTTLINDDAVSVTAPTLLPINVEARNATLSWNAPATVVGKLVDYAVTVTQAGQADRVFKTTATTYVVSDLQENVSYTFGVKANAASLNGKNLASASSAPATHTTPYAADTVAVGAPRLLGLTAPTYSVITASWAAPSPVAGSITGYTVTLRSGNTALSTRTVTNLSTTFTGLTANTNYSVEVVAHAVSADETKTAVSAAVSAAITTPASISAPNAPTSFKASSVTHNSAVLTWDAPSGVIGNLKDYTIVLKQTGMADRTVTATGNTYTLTELLENTSYTAQIAANITSALGTGTLTSPSAATELKTLMPFNDVNGSIFIKEISWMKDKGISTGWDDGSYRSLQPVNRDAMAAFMYRLAGKPAFTEPAVSPFIDLPVGTQFYKEITWLAAQGISTGWDEPGNTKSYRPLQPVNRDAMAAFMYRLAGKPPFTEPAASPFIDVSGSTQFYKEITWLA